jgi:hypothetical protein
MAWTGTAATDAQALCRSDLPGWSFYREALGEEQAGGQENKPTLTTGAVFELSS